MITKFDTSGVSTTSTSKGGGSKILTYLIIGAALFAGYKFVLKPYLDKKNATKNEG
jgi:hypothetical protein